MPKKIFVIAGEPSGDAIGKEILSSIKKRAPNIEIRGVGGALMEDAGGFKSILPFSDLSHMGASIITKIPMFLRYIKYCTNAIHEFAPDILLTIDSPEFCFRVSSRVKCPRRIHCVAPSVWAWRPGRARIIHKHTDHLLGLFPFEKPYFHHSQIGFTFVGHPAVSRPRGNASAFRRKYNMSQENLLCILPGSRASEVSSLLPIFIDAVAILKDMTPFIMTTSSMLALIEKVLAGRDIPVVLDHDKSDAFAASSCALCASGTITLELAIAGAPMVVAYKISKILAAALKYMICTDYVALPNIIAGEKIVPEFLQNDCNPESLAAAISLLIHDNGAIQKQRLATATSSLCAGKTFGEMCADEIFKTAESY